MTGNRFCRRRALSEGLGSHALGKRTFSHILFSLAALLALFIQTLVVQPHIHVARAANTLSVVLVGAVDGKSNTASANIAKFAKSTALPHDKFPINEDPANCPLCQEIVHSGPLIQAVAVFEELPVSPYAVSRFSAEVLPPRIAPSYAWQGRAPPKA